MAEIKLIVSSTYGTLSRGRHSARLGNGGSAVWADKDAHGNIVITAPGQWALHCSDGFKRSAKAVLTVEPNGDWEMTGETRRFDVKDESPEPAAVEPTPAEVAAAEAADDATAAVIAADIDPRAAALAAARELIAAHGFTAAELGVAADPYTPPAQEAGIARMVSAVRTGGSRQLLLF